MITTLILMSGMDLGICLAKVAAGGNDLKRRK